MGDLWPGRRWGASVPFLPLIIREALRRWVLMMMMILVCGGVCGLYMWCLVRCLVRDKRDICVCVCVYVCVCVCVCVYIVSSLHRVW